ncbi:Protein CBG25926 [Caenorhabditis briggsae]|uniref:Protein CBG25926 n=2 Tax=Caenorhabditis briggsae TaxID=6238 RepID=B6IK58_CAEBR|nr:Protein CBG25926 [Caenorhabditis briggsae]CAS00288.1 Protein CBG25926 [Caenorhabditis briggsae]
MEHEEKQKSVPRGDKRRRDPGSEHLGRKGYCRIETQRREELIDSEEEKGEDEEHVITPLGGKKKEKKRGEENLVSRVLLLLHLFHIIMQ